MLQKFLPWVIVGWIALYLLSVMGSIIPWLFAIIGSAIAVCCAYALLPPQFRYQPVEEWLGYKKVQRQSKKRSTSSNHKNQSSDQEDAENTEEIETIEEDTDIEQPELDFSSIFSTKDKLPDREELKAQLKSKVIGQDEAIDSIVRVTLGKLAAKKSTKPLVIFLPGPTGSGKTEMAKALALALDTELIRFDMGEYADQFKSSNLFGSSKGYAGSEDGGALPNAIRKSKSKCVILFDEVEKAHQSLWRQLLAFFDEGRVGDTLGQSIAPKNTICLLTSNIEAEKIAQNPDQAKDIIKACGFFPPEFIGRINKIVPLLRLNLADTAKLTTILAKKIADEYEISLIIHQQALNDLMEAVAEEADKYGGRGIMEKVKDLILDDLIDLQADGVSHAKLEKQGDRFKAIPI